MSNIYEHIKMSFFCVLSHWFKWKISNNSENLNYLYTHCIEFVTVKVTYKVTN